jgi:hypothetical protein
LTSVRITASWALANLCDALRYRVDDRSFEGTSTDVMIRPDTTFGFTFLLSS